MGYSTKSHNLITHNQAVVLVLEEALLVLRTQPTGKNHAR